MTAYTQRIEVGAYYTDGRDLWEVMATNPLGTVTLHRVGGTKSGSGETVGRCLGIDAFRQQMWLVRQTLNNTAAARFARLTFGED